MRCIADIEIKKISSMPQGPRRLGFQKPGHRQPNVRNRFLWLILGIIYFSTAWTVAPAAEVTDLIINNSQGHLLLSLNIQDALTKESGEPATDEPSSTIVFSIELYQVRNYWFDKKITYQTATNTLKYNPSKKKYSLMRSWNSGPPTVVATLDQAEKLMTEVKDLKVVRLARLEKGKNYQIRVQAACQDENASIFGPSGCFKTDWYTVDFTF
jgi:hypothetical protein